MASLTHPLLQIPSVASLKVPSLQVSQVSLSLHFKHPGFLTVHGYSPDKTHLASLVVESSDQVPDAYLHTASPPIAHLVEVVSVEAVKTKNKPSIH